MKTEINTRSVQLQGVHVTVSEAGEGRAVLILHGGGGPQTVAPIAEHFAQSAHTLTPTHPGWNGTERPEWFNGIDDLAIAYLSLLGERGLRDVLVIGSSMGGWVAAEMAVRDQAGLITGIVLIGGLGIDLPEHPMCDFFNLTPRGIAEHAFHDPERFFVDPSDLPPEQVARQRANIAALRVVAGDMHDPKLLRRLGRVRIPALALWGESDRVVTPAYGKAYAAAFAKGRFEVIERAGHLPQIEQPATTFARLDAFRAQVI